MSSYTEVFNWASKDFKQKSYGANSSSIQVPRFCTYNILIFKLACGDEHAAFISKFGHVYTMGSNEQGRLGLGDSRLKESSAPVLVEKLLTHHLLDVSCGLGHTAVLTQNGAVFSWGMGKYGSLGLGDLRARYEPSEVPVSGVCSIHCGSRSTGAVCMKRGKNILKMWGDGEAGQLGTKRRKIEVSPVDVHIENPVYVACGRFHTLFLTRDGAVYAVGANSEGQLGTGNKKPSAVPVKIEHIKGKVNVLACGSHSGCITEQGDLYLWGTGTFGEYLVPHKVSLPVPMRKLSIGNGFGGVIDKVNRLWTWGSNYNGELGLGGTSPRDFLSLVEVLGNKRISSVSCGSRFTIALGSDVHSRQGTNKSRKAKSRTPTAGNTIMKSDEAAWSSTDCFREIRKFIEMNRGERILPMFEYINERYMKLYYYYSRERNKRKELEEVSILKEIQTTERKKENQSNTKEIKRLMDLLYEKEKQRNESYREKTDENELGKEKRRRNQLETEVKSCKRQISNKDEELFSVKNEVASLRNKLCDLEHSEAYRTCAALEAELTDSFAQKLNEKDRMIRRLSLLLGEHETNPLDNTKFLSTPRTDKCVVNRYQPSPAESQLSPDLSPLNLDMHKKALSDFYQMRLSKSASEFDRMTDSPLDNILFMSPAPPREEHDSPRFLVRGNTPPTFREGGLTESVRII